MIVNTHWYSIISLILINLLFINCNDKVGNSNFRVISILPSIDDQYQLSSNTPITVIFNRPVIRLGELVTNYFPFNLNCNVPVDGKYRWVTNSIARFDPTDNWKSNLNCSFTIDNSILETFDGLKLVEIPKIINFSTPAPSISITRVFSEQTEQLTEDHWTSDSLGILSNGSSISLHEVPSDGIIQIEIQPGFENDYILKSLVIQPVNDKKISNLKYEIVSCPTYNKVIPLRKFRYYGPPTQDFIKSNICIRIKDTLKVGSVYKMKFSKGTQLSKSSGPLTQDIILEFVGLYVFKYAHNLEQPNYSTIRLFQRHGLKSSVTSEMFEKVIQFTPKVKNLEITLVNSYILQFTGNFKYQNYTISFKSSNEIVDGWGLTLESHSFNFSMSPTPSYYFLPLQTSYYFDKSESGITGNYIYYQNLNRETCYFNNSEQQLYNVKLSGWSVNEKNLKDIILSYGNNSISNLKVKANQVENLSFDKTDNVYSVSLDVNELWKDSNVYLEVHSRCNDQITDIKFIGKNEISVSQLNGIPNQGSIGFYITSTKEPYSSIEGAIVEYYVFKRNENYQIQNVTLLSTGVSSKNGVAKLPFDLSKPNDNSGILVVKYSNDKGPKKIFIQNTWFSTSDTYDIRHQFITDRALYNGGDTIHFKGYIKGSILKQVKIICKVYFRISQIQSIYQANIVNIDYRFGSFSLDIPIPENVDGGVYSIDVSSDSDQNISFYYGHTFTVSDSQLPTGILTLSTNQEFISLDESVTGSRAITLNLTTSNYLGQPQNNQTVTINWKSPVENIIESVQPNLRSIKLGTVTTVTDKNGCASYTFTFNSNDFIINYGDSISFDASYIDPSGTKFVAQSITRYFVNSKYIIKNYVRSYIEDVPSIPQPISIGILELPNLKPLVGLPVELTLTQWVDLKSKVTKEINSVKLSNLELNVNENTANNSGSSIILDQNKTCKFKSKSNRKKSSYDSTTISPPDCYYILPDVGTYVIVARAIAPNGEKIQSTYEVGKDSQFWKENLWALSSEIEVCSNKEFYNENEPIEIEIFNNLNNSKLFIQYGCMNSSTNYLEFNNLPFGKQKLKLPCPSCHQTIFLSGILLSRNLGFKFPPQFPFSRQSFSLNRLHHQTFSMYIAVKSESKLSLQVTLDKKDKIYVPGDKGSLTIEVLEKKSKKLTKSQVEACIMIIDKRNLDLLPNPLSNGDSLRDISIYVSGISYLSEMVTNYVDMIKRIYQRLQKDPYVTSWFNFDLYDKEFINQYTSYLNQYSTGLINFYGGFPVMESFASNDRSFSKSKDSGGGSSPSSDQVPRESFSTTPLYIDKLIVKDGKAQVPFSLPDDVTTFEIRVYIMQSISLDSPFEFLSTSEFLIAKKDNTIQPILPNFIRNGDSFEIGAMLTVQKIDIKQLFRLSIDIESTSIQLDHSNEPSQYVKASGYSTNVYFKCNANSVSEKNFITISLYQNSSLLDSFRVPIVVLGKQLPVYVGTSMNILANSTVAEGIQLPKSEDGSGTLKINAGVGRYPAVEEKCLTLLNLNIGQTPSSVDLISKQVTFGSLNAYQYNTSLVQKSKEILAKIANSFSNYMAYDSIKWYPYSNQGDIYPTLYSLMIKKLLKVSNINGWSIIDFNENYSEKYVDEYLNTMVNLLKNSNKTILVDKEFIGKASIGLGYYWSPTDFDLIDLYSWNALTLNISDNCSLQCQCYFAIAAIIRGEGDSKFIPIVIKNLENNLRIQGRTAYISESPTSSYSSLSLTTYASLTMILSNYSNSLVLDKLMNFISQGGVSVPNVFAYYPIGLSPEVQALSVIALTLNDKVKSSNNPSLTFTAYQNTENYVLMNQEFSPKSHSPVTKTISFSDLPQNNGTIYFKSFGSGEISAAIGLEYTPLELPSQPVYNGIIVDKVLTLSDGTPIYNCSKQLKVGQEIKILISITTNDDISDITIIDSISAGISPLDSLVYSEDNNNPYYSRTNFIFYQPFQFKETKRDKVIFHATGISAGSYQVQFNAIVSHSGSFTLPPTKVYSSTQPELFGFSTGCKIEISRQ